MGADIFCDIYIQSIGPNPFTSKLFSSCQKCKNGIIVSNCYYILVACHIFKMVFCLVGLLQHH